MLTYKQYLDKAYGCWLGKCVAGTIGAPYEGMKQLLHLSFRSEMIEKMLPNDDLDLQVLWLKVLEEKGIYTTGDDLAAAFSKYNVFWPGEYAWFKKITIGDCVRRIRQSTKTIFITREWGARSVPKFGGLSCPATTR